MYQATKKKDAGVMDLVKHLSLSVDDIGWMNLRELIEKCEGLSPGVLSTIMDQRRRIRNRSSARKHRVNGNLGFEELKERAARVKDLRYSLELEEAIRKEVLRTLEIDYDCCKAQLYSCAGSVQERQDMEMRVMQLEVSSEWGEQHA